MTHDHREVSASASSSEQDIDELADDEKLRLLAATSDWTPEVDTRQTSKG